MTWIKIFWVLIKFHFLSSFKGRTKTENKQHLIHIHLITFISSKVGLYYFYQNFSCTDQRKIQISFTNCLTILMIRFACYCLLFSGQMIFDVMPDKFAQLIYYVRKVENFFFIYYSTLQQYLVVMTTLAFIKKRRCVKRACIVHDVWMKIHSDVREGNVNWEYV